MVKTNQIELVEKPSVARAISNYTSFPGEEKKSAYVKAAELI